MLPDQSSGLDRQSSRIAAYALVFVAWLIGSVSLLLFFAGFLFFGPLGLIDLDLGELILLVLDALLCLAFFLQHSGMIRRSYRQWSAKLIQPQYEGAIYTITSGAILLLLLVLWQESAWVLYKPEGVLRWLLRTIYFLAVAGFIWSILTLGSFDAFGLRPILDRLRDIDSPACPFTVSGPFHWVRHPLYFLSLLMIWSYPDMTADRLLFNVSWTIWIVVGTVLEERDLVAVFGQAYRDYQRQVPMLIPYRLYPAR